MTFTCKFYYPRSQLIPGIVIFLQKMCRGTLARKQYQRMLAARYVRVG